MDFVDRVLVAIADPNARAGLFGDAALKAILRAAYGVDPGALQGQAAPRFDRVTLGGLEPQGDAPAPPEPPAPAARIEALWRGSIRVSASWPRARIEGVQAGALPLGDLDAAVAAAAGGALPADPAALEAARRAEILARLRGLLSKPEAAGDAVLDAWLSAAGVPDVAGLLAAGEGSALLGFQLALSEPLGGAGFSQMDFPVAAALLVRDPADPGMRLAEMIRGARLVQAEMRRAGFEPASASEAGGMGRAVPVLLAPRSWFDDQHWPGADSDARIASATDWLAREGLALAPAA